MIGTATINCPECSSKIKVDFSALERTALLPPNFALTSYPDFCPSCGDWIGRFRDKLRQAAIDLLAKHLNQREREKYGLGEAT